MEQWEFEGAKYKAYNFNNNKNNQRNAISAFLLQVTELFIVSESKRQSIRIVRVRARERGFGYKGKQLFYSKLNVQHTVYTHTLACLSFAQKQFIGVFNSEYVENLLHTIHICGFY